MNGEAPQLGPQEAREAIESGLARAVDVREVEEWEAGRLAGSLWIPLSELPGRLGELDDADPLVIVCRTGSRSGYVADALSASGRDASNLAGGLQAWVGAGLPLEPDGGYVL